MPRALLFLVLFALLPGIASAASDSAEQRAKLKALRERIADLREQMQAKTGEKTEASEALQNAEQQIGRLARKVRVLDGRLERQRDRLDGLRIEQAAQTKALQQQRRVLARQVRAAYAMGRQERLKILLNQQDPATVSRMMVYYDYLSRARVQKMRVIHEHMAQLAETEHEIATEEAKLERLRGEQETELLALRGSQAQRRAIVERLTLELSDQSKNLDRLQSDEQQLKTLIDGLERALADIPAEHPQQTRFSGLRGKLPWPASGSIVKRFGAPKLGNLQWDGVMISAPEGREVRAVHHGRVAFADWLRGFGLLLIVDHGDGYMTLYGHNQSLFKEAGDWVDVNEPIALVGSSGGRERSGVYFGIRHEGKPVNPAKWCRRATGNKVG
ncbi:murein hydrolase activator EnvC family protein [Thiosocius teredinicola]|uniref:murein hydrolase activator EnvC family protein n=1 Tax=Thiosocius teredinicola TaxID=1973002 RepID=UPI0013DE00AE